MLWLNLCGVITKSNRIGGGKRVGLARASQVPPQFIVWTIPRQHESQIDMPQARYDLRCLQVGVEAATSRCNTAGTVGKKAKLKAEAGVYPTQAGSADVGRLKLVAENRLLRPVGDTGFRILPWLNAAWNLAMACWIRGQAWAVMHRESRTTADKASRYSYVF